jgi:hypothetical protein
MNENNEGVLCSEYLCNEALKPKQVEYGIDNKNKEWKQLDNFFVTFFQYSNDQYCFIYRDGFVGFVTINEDISKINKISQILNRKNFRQTNSYLATHIFNFIFYLIIEAIKEFNATELYFDGMTDGLNSFYEFLMKNKSFNMELEQQGFVYVGKEKSVDREFYKFKKE